MLCPTCKKPVADTEKDRPRFHPFCSERCKLVDLGRWLGGKYQIPVREEDSDDLDSQDLPPPPDEDSSK